MYNYDNEYAQPGYETNYEFNPQYESDFETGNFANESDFEYANPEYNREESYEAENDYENNWQNEVVVRDHRTGARPAGIFNTTTSRPFIATTRPGYYRPAGTFYQRRYYKPPYYRSGNSLYSRPTYRSSYYRNRWPYNFQRNLPWYRRYSSPTLNYGYNYTDQSQQYTQGNDMNMQPQSQGSGGTPDYILQSIQNLSRQVAATNANVDALQQSMASANRQDNMGAAPQNSNVPAGAAIGTQDAGRPGAAQPSGGEFEMEDHEFEMENGIMNEEGNNEMMEMEMAAELLATNNEMELDHFLGGLFGDGGLKNLFKGVIKNVLPVAGAAAGSFFGGPLGAKVGQQIGSAASGMFELELEGLSNEDQEFEVARAIIRLAADTARKLETGGSTGNPDEDAKNALIQSAMRNAPGLLVKKRRDIYNSNSGYGGNWHRRGNKIVIENAF